VVAAPIVEAHRGSTDPAAGVWENTLEAFARARRVGADGVELDVRLTADGALAVHHDEVVPGSGPVSALTVRQLPVHVPLLEAVLDLLDDLVVNVEVKNLPTEESFDPTERAARAAAGALAGRDPERTLVSSFWPGALDAVREVDAGVPTGLLVVPRMDPAGAVDAAVARGCRAVHPHHSVVTASLVTAAHDAGLAVAAWTVNDPATTRSRAAPGGDGVITDDVPGVRAALTGP
jgi:glycerophosphoryl diester phosphodiesterase